MYKLSELSRNCYVMNHPLALDDGRTITWGLFMTDVEATRKLIVPVEHESWALFQTDTYRFAVNLFALLAEGKNVYLPGDNNNRIATKLVDQDIALLGQFRSSTFHDIELAKTHGEVGDFRLLGKIVIYTSGSTGAAKPIQKTLAQIDSELLSLESSWGGSWQDPVVASTVSHQHLYGLLFALLWPICSGRVFFRKPFIDPGIMAKSTGDLKEAVWVMSPAHLHRMSSNINWSTIRSRVSAVFSSGGPLQQQAAQGMYESLGHYPVEVLGSSETGGIAWREQKNTMTPWTTLPGVSVKLDFDGALCVASPWLDNEQWYGTSDLATMAGEGVFHLGMRKDRIVKLEGKRVALPEVEAALIQHPWIEDAAALVVNRNRPTVGAVLSLTQQGILAEQDKGRYVFTRELRDSLRQKMAVAGIPRLWRITPEIIKNSQGKTALRSLKKLFHKSTLPDVKVQKEMENFCILELYVEADNEYLEGHFPAKPVLAGVVQLLWAQQFADEYFSVSGQFAGMKTIKFRSLILPQTKLQLQLEYAPETGQLKFQYDSVSGRHSQGTLLFGAGA